LIGMVLAAGTGRRLRPHTDGRPKALLPVAGETTILDLALRNLAESGLADVVIVVGYAAEMVADRIPALERAYGLSIDLVYNERAEEWNNAYSLWLAREYFRRGVMLVNGDTVHPASVEKTLLAASAAIKPDPVLGRLIIAIDDIKSLADEEMKVVLDDERMLLRITKVMDPVHAHGEYMGVTLIEPTAAVALADCLEATWRGNPNLYYEDAFAEFSERGGAVLGASIGMVDWVEVDDLADLHRAREIASRC
jgi:choline kinase